MTFFLFAIGVTLVGVTGRLVAQAVVVPRLRLKRHLHEIRDYGFESRVSAGPELSSLERFKLAFRATAERTGGFMMRRFPTFKALDANELGAAGFYDVTPEAVHGYRVIATFTFPLLMLLLLLPAGKISGLDILMLLFTGAAGGVLPSFIIRKRGAARLDEVDRQLPELIDLLIATIEAGMSFSQSIALIAQRFGGALGDEMRMAMKQQRLGMSITQVLDEMGERCGTPAVRSFVRTASRGETLGASIGPIMRELSADQRRRRRMAAREKMQKAPVKMIFPLMFLIMPALFIVLMFPAAYALSTNLKGI
jgi:tight adherence protein C